MAKQLINTHLTSPYHFYFQLTFDEAMKLLRELSGKKEEFTVEIVKGFAFLCLFICLIGFFFLPYLCLFLSPGFFSLLVLSSFFSLGSCPLFLFSFVFFAFSPSSPLVLLLFSLISLSYLLPSIIILPHNLTI